MFNKTFIKTITPANMVKDSTVHVSVYSNKTVKDDAARNTVVKELRAYGFMVYDVTLDRLTDRALMVSATIR